MPRTRFYNRRFALRAPAETASLETPSPPWASPPAFDVRIRLESGRFRRSFGEDAGPPRGHPASNGRMFDGMPTGFGRTGSHDAPERNRGKNRRGFIGLRTVLPSRTSDTLRASARSGRNRDTRSPELAPVAARQRLRLHRARGAFHRKEAIGRALLRGFFQGSAARHWPMEAATARVHWSSNSPD